MNSVLDFIWKTANVILVLVIVATGVYIFLVNPGQMLGEFRKDIRPADVRMQSQAPQVVGGLNFMDPGHYHHPYQNNPSQGNKQVALNPVAVNPNDPYGVGQVAAVPAVPDTFTDPFNIRQIATQNRSIFSDKILQEGHWAGMEVIPLTPTIAQANQIPDTVSGVLVDEVTLASAVSGLLAGDVVTAINGVRVHDLHSFKNATKPVAMSPQARVSVYRNGSYPDILLNANEELGIAQMEAAPMILATDVRPHGYYGPCDRCHTISKSAKNTGQLAKDAGDVLATTAPPIKWGAKPLHKDRGACTNCHSII